MSRRVAASLPVSRVLTFQSLACGVAVVAVAAIPSLFNPRGHDAFTVARTGLIEGVGPLAAVCAAFALPFDLRRRAADPIILASAAVAVTLVLATALGVVPALSFFAPGVRHEGTFVALSLVAIGFAAATLSADQTDWLVTAIVVGSIGPAAYTLIEAVLRTVNPEVPDPGSPAGNAFGNPMLLGGYLATVIPITAARALGALTPDRRQGNGRRFPWESVAYAAVVSIQAVALVTVRARGAALATMVAFVLIAAGWKRRSITRRSVVILAVGGAAVAVAGVAILARGHTTIGSGTTEVRLLIWTDVGRLLLARPSRLLLGYGPEMLPTVIAPFHAPDLARLEGLYAVSDRAHNDLLDTVVATGLAGTAAVMALHFLLWFRLRRALSSPTEWTARHWTCLGLLAAAIAHFVDIQVGIATVASRLNWWCIVGMAVALSRTTISPSAEAGTVRRESEATAVASMAALAALTFAFWAGGDGAMLTRDGWLVIAATGAIAAAIGVSRRPPGAGVIAARLLPSAAAIGGMAAVLSAAGASGEENLRSIAEVVAMGDRLSHQAIVAYLVFGIMAAAAAYLVGATGTIPRRSRRIATPVLGALLFGVLTLAAGARTVRADMLAHLADGMQVARRTMEAEALQQRRVEITPESDVAWSALGRAELELAREETGSARADRFSRALSALAEARRRSPLDWIHYRNQASAERQWAAADPSARTAHLDAADRFYRQAAALAPAASMLWAEWGNADAERGALPEAFGKLERAADLGDLIDAKAVADVLLRATGIEVRDPGGPARAASRLEREGRPVLASLYAARPAGRE